MTKDEKNKAESEGIIILRAQFNHQKQCWRICKHTSSGGWEIFKNEPFTTQEKTNDTIDWYVRQYPSMYIKD